MIGLRFALILLLLGPATSAWGADNPPAWLRQSAAAALPEGLQQADAVVLLNESSLVVSPKGQLTVSKRFAVRIQTRDGSSAAVARQVYNTDSQKVRSLKAWLIPPSGKVAKYGKKEIVDLALADNDIYNEVRVQAIVAGSDAAPGSVFGFEATLEERSVFTQYDWSFQGRLATRLSRFRLTLPAGWESSHVVFNHDPVEPAASGSSQVWELTALPEIVQEPMSPPLTSLAPRLALSWYPPRESPLNAHAFTDWSGVSRWLARLSDPQAVPDDQVTSKAQSLAVQAESEFEKIQAIGSFVQGVQYVSIQTGLGRGGGFKPRSASEVLSKRYGDCKDKANLMRSMLRTVGISSYPVAIFSGDADYVRREWPSPQQFNHAILAVQLSESVESPAMVDHPKLGRLLLFDPTNDLTPLGSLPDYLEGGLALLAASEDGGILEVPSTPPQSNALQRGIKAALRPDGSLAASIREESQGQSAVDELRLLRSVSRDEYVRIIERWVTQGVSGARVLKVEPDYGENDTFVLQINLQAPRYGQLMQGRLLIFKPALVSRRNFLTLTAAQRHHPVSLSSQAYREEARFQLPPGFAVDEQPAPVEIEESFGSYRAKCWLEEGVLVYQRSLTLRRSTVPVAEYDSVRRFFEQVRDSEQTPVVLLKR